MNLIKRSRRRRRPAAAQQSLATRDDSSGKEVVEKPSSDTAVCPTGWTLDAAAVETPDDTAVEPAEISGSPNANLESSVLPEAVSDCLTLFDLVENVDHVLSTGLPDALDDTCDSITELIDPSKWFEPIDGEHMYEGKEDPHITLSEESLSAPICASNPGDTFDLKSALDVYASTVANVDEIEKEIIDSAAAAQATSTSQDERRKYPRQDSSDLIWVEYFNSSMESTGKEAARVENVGAGGMRVGVKTAPLEVERAIVSYPYRGFESCSIVRSSFQDENGQLHLCLEFVDREWEINATHAIVENTAHPVNPRKVLLADDDSAFRRILGNILIKAGYEVVLAEDGQSAVEKAITEKPDLVITDGLMPKLHGFQVCKAIKELSPQTGVILLTAVYTSPNYQWEAKHKFGADDIIIKPCETADLLRRIEKHMPRVA